MLYTSKVVVNGLPKGGTYLLHRVVESIGKWMKEPIHINDNYIDYIEDDGSWESVEKDALSSLETLQPGDFAGAHIRFKDKIEEFFLNNNIKHIFIYRDIRDTFVSMLDFILNSDKNLTTAGGVSLHNLIKRGFLNNAQRLYFIINSRKDWDFEGFTKWVGRESCFSVKFEDLYPDILKAKDGEWGDTLKSIFKYLEVNIDEYDPVTFFKDVYGQGRTFYKGENKVSGYKEVFEPQHYELMDNPNFVKANRDMGYD